MLLSLNALTRAAIPTVVATAAIATPASAQVAAPIDTALTAGALAPIATGSPAVPASGRLVRVLDHELDVSATDRDVSVRAVATTVPVVAELRVGKTGRLIDSAHAGAKSHFRVHGRARGGEHLRLVVRRSDGGHETTANRVGQVRSLRPTQASWFGPGLFGSRTACGQTLTASLHGVAHKSLPCGTKLTIRYHGRTTDTKVVDRGPFVGNREFDLTAATAQAIGFRDVGRVWVSR